MACHCYTPHHSDLHKKPSIFACRAQDSHSIHRLLRDPAAFCHLSCTPCGRDAGRCLMASEGPGECGSWKCFSPGLQATPITFHPRPSFPLGAAVETEQQRARPDSIPATHPPRRLRHCLMLDVSDYQGRSWGGGGQSAWCSLHHRTVHYCRHDNEQRVGLARCRVLDTSHQSRQPGAQSPTPHMSPTPGSMAAACPWGKVVGFLGVADSWRYQAFLLRRLLVWSAKA